MKAELEALHAGRISFDQFAQQTRREWEKLAARLFRSYALPAGVEHQDIVQEMCLHAWQAVGTWDPAYGTQLVRYVTWTAYSEARRWVNVQRNAYRRSDHVAGRYPLAVAQLSTDDHEFDIESVAGDEADADVNVMAHERFLDLAGQLETEGQRVALEAWAVAGNESAAAEMLESDFRVVIALKLWTPGAAQRLVHTAIEATLQAAAVV